MTDLETRLRSLAAAAAAVAVQPSTDELGFSRRPVRRRWVPVTAIAAATAGIIALGVTRPWAGTSDGPAAGDVGCPGKQTTIAYELSGGSLPADQLTAVVRSRVAALTADGCVTTGPDGTVAVRLGDAGRGSVSAASFRTDLYVAPVKSVCGRTCDGPTGAPGTLFFSDPASGFLVVDELNEMRLTGHVTRSSAGVGVNGGDYQVTLQLDTNTGQKFGDLTAGLVGASQPHNQLAIVVDGVVIAVPVVQGAITDGNVQISGSYTEQQARQLAAELSAPSVPSDVTIRPVGSTTATPTSFPTSPYTLGPTASAPRPAPSEGTLPPMPSSGVRGTNTDDPNGVYAAGPVLDVYASELEKASGVVDSIPTPKLVPGWCGVGIDAPHDGVILWWKGKPPAALLAVLARAKAGGVTPEVVNTQYDRLALQPTVDELVKHMVGGKPITSLHVANDCRGVEVGLDAMTAANKAQVRALAPDPTVPLLFELRHMSTY